MNNLELIQALEEKTDKMRRKLKKNNDFLNILKYVYHWFPDTYSQDIYENLAFGSLKKKWTTYCISNYVDPDTDEGLDNIGDIFATTFKNWRELEYKDLIEFKDRLSEPFKEYFSSLDNEEQNQWRKTCYPPKEDD